MIHVVPYSFVYDYLENAFLSLDTHSGHGVAKINKKLAMLFTLQNKRKARHGGQADDIVSPEPACLWRVAEGLRYTTTASPPDALDLRHACSLDFCNNRVKSL